MRVDTTGRTIDEALDDVVIELSASGYLRLDAEQRVDTVTSDASRKITP